MGSASQVEAGRDGSARGDRRPAQPSEPYEIQRLNPMSGRSSQTMRRAVAVECPRPDRRIISARPRRAPRDLFRNWTSAAAAPPPATSIPWASHRTRIGHTPPPRRCLPVSAGVGEWQRRPSRTPALPGGCQCLAMRGSGWPLAPRVFESRMGLEAEHAGRTANPAAMRGLRLSAGVTLRQSHCLACAGFARRVGAPVRASCPDP